MINTTLENKKIVILGGSSGIGFLIAKAALEAGAKVIIASRNESKVIKRSAMPQEIAMTALYLMSNTYSTGNTLFIDGGLTFR